MNPAAPAFPIVYVPGDFDRGLTKRELIAAMAMQGHLAAYPPHFHATDAERNACIASRAPLCVAWADALLVALAKEPQS